MKLGKPLGAFEVASITPPRQSGSLSTKPDRVRTGTGRRDRR